MKIAIGCDHAAFDAKNKIIEFLKEKGYEVKDFGTFSDESCDYADYAYPVCKAVVSGEYDKGVLICGTGIGMSISANKVIGIRCALCGDVFSTEMTRKHNDSNVLAMGARVVSVDKMKEIVSVYLSTDFEGGRHQRRIDKIAKIEREEHSKTL